MNFTLSINEKQMKAIRQEAERLNVSVASFIKMKTLDSLKIDGGQS